MEQSQDSLVGRVLDGRYRVGPRVARGGMAVVHEATDLRLDRVVAVKIMHAGLADDPAFVKRFEREARSAAKLAHQNVVAVFDQGDDNGTLFLVMEYVPGHTLRDVMRAEAPFSPLKALSLLEPVLNALGAAHSAGMIHRDVKPENVLVGDGTSVKVADFGLARAVNSETQHTATGGVLIGTVSYLSPELVVDGHSDARSDVYAAGILLFELLTGRKPHQADNPIQVAYKHVHEDIPPPSQYAPGLPAYVDALVARATAREQSLRPADAAVFLHQMRRVRQALEHGIEVDDELTADLAPRATGSDVERTGELPTEIIDTSEPGAAERIEEVYDTGSVPAYQPSQTAYQDPPGLDGEETRAVGRHLALGTMPAEAPPDAVDGATSAEKPAHRNSRRGPLLIGLLVLAAIAVAMGSWWFGSGRYTVTPGVVDLSQAAAKAKVEKAGLKFKVAGHEFSETAARGAVIRTDPAAGDRILNDGTVGAVISRGPERYDVPKVAGMSVDAAQRAIQDRSLEFGRTVEKFNGSVPKGKVIGSDPEAGTPQPPDTAIDLLVSKGPKPILIPDVTGEPLAVATETLKRFGFKVDATVRVFDDLISAGRVVDQAPDKGRGFKGDSITLTVSKGPQNAIVPDVMHMPVDEARAALRNAGFNVAVTRSQFYIGLDRVGSISPAPGTQVAGGTTVTIALV